MKISVFLLLPLFLFASCSPGFESKEDRPMKITKNKKKANEPIVLTEEPGNYALRAFIKKFPVISLPVTIRPLHDEFKDLEWTNMRDSIDKKFFALESRAIYGILPDTGKYYALITLVPGDAMVPLLTTFTKTGRKISEEGLIVRGCALDPGTLFCSVAGRINKDLSIFCVDSVKTVDTDKEFHPVKGSEKMHVTTVEGKIETNGKITMQPEKEVVK